MATDAAIKECFEIFDKDNDGKISKEEAGQAIRAMGKNPTRSELDAALSSVADPMDLATFMGVYKGAQMPGPKDQEEAMRNAFKALDKDGTGKIDAAQLRQILATLGDVMKSDEIDSLFKEITVGADGLDYNAFVDTLVNSYAVSDRPEPWTE